MDQTELNKIENFYLLFKDYIKPNSWALDIGANMGLASLAIERLGASKIIAFEPNPLIFSKLQENVKDNKIFDIYNLACDSSYRKAEFAYGEDNSGLMQGFSEKEERGRGQRMDFQCIDTQDFLLKKYHLEDLKKISLIKVDAEGMDPFILQNLKDLIKLIKPIIIIEWWFHESKNKITFDIIKEIGYIAYRSDNRQIASEDQFNNKSEDLILLPE